MSAVIVDRLISRTSVSNPQGLVLCPTLLSIYFNDVMSALEHSSCTLFVDDREIHFSHKDVNLAVTRVNQDLSQIEKWLKDNEMAAYPRKSDVMVKASRPVLKTTKETDINIHLQDPKLKNMDCFKYLRVYVDSKKF